MDNKALAETYVDLWEYINGCLQRKGYTEPPNEITNMIFEQTCKRIISDLIGKQRSSGGSAPGAQHDDKPSEKQIAWAKKLGCHNPEGFSRKELSEWLDENKNF